MRTIKRILSFLVAVLVVLASTLVLSVVLDYAVGSDRIQAISNTLIPGAQGQPDVHAYVTAPAGPGPFPAVIMIHEFFGLNASITGKAEGLAEEGYLVVAPDTFRGSTTAWIPRAIYQVITTQPEDVNADLDSVFAWLASHPQVDAQRIAVLGFCYGGRAALQYSLHNERLAATVVFYGAPETDPEVLEHLPGPVLGIFGGADQSIPLEEVQAFETSLQAAGVPHEVTIYEGQPHAFITGMEAIRSGGAPAQAWEQMLRFLETSLVQREAGVMDQQSTYRASFPLRYYALLVFEHAFGPASHGH